MSKGIDYAWQHPTLDFLRSNNYTFACRYLSSDPSKNLTEEELGMLRSIGMSAVVVWETTADRMKSGHAAGQADAQAADSQCNKIGCRGIPVYFACDFDAAPGDQAAINDYLDGAASVLGRNRVGIYGGYYPVKRALDAGKAKYAWQTFAWSGGQWDNRANIRQVANHAQYDDDQSMTADFGQFPRPGSQNGPGVSTVDVTVTLPVLSEGSSGNGVKLVQGALTVHGQSVNIDGSFGPATRAAVGRFQASAGVAQDGVVGHDTWSKLLTP